MPITEEIRQAAENLGKQLGAHPAYRLSSALNKKSSKTPGLWNWKTA